MLNPRPFLVSSIVIYMLSLSCQAPVSAFGRIQTQENVGIYSISVPGSNVILSFPKEQLERASVNPSGATQSPRYFVFKTPDSKIRFSGWFETSNRFTNAKDIWDKSLAKRINANLPAPRDIKFGRINKWDCIFYNIDFGSNNYREISAHVVQGNTWIELRVSVRVDQSIESAEKSAYNLIESTLLASTTL